MKNFASGLILGSLMAGCASTSLPPQSLSNVSIRTNFETGNISEVKLEKSGFHLSIAPEDTPINNSPWYAFDIIGAKGKTVPITLSYSDGKHRYTPKVQSPNGSWKVLESPIDIASDKSTATFSITPSGDTLRIAAQPIIDTQDHLNWIEKMATLDFVSSEIIGRSIEDRAIYKLEEIDAPHIEKPYILFIGRQHPPELTGAQALMPFVETVWGDSDLAKQFRAEYNLIVIPLLNPDGVAHGHWRHNLGGLDLNRDWGPFTQPETKAVETEFSRFRSGEDKIVLFLDFHSTWRNLIYTQTDSEPTKPAFFTRDWIRNVKSVLPKSAYSFTREANKMTDRPVSKNYMYRTYGIPAMTFEVGDDTPQSATENASKIFAEEMMTLLLLETTK